MQEDIKEKKSSGLMARAEAINEASNKPETTLKTDNTEDNPFKIDFDFKFDLDGNTNSGGSSAKVTEKLNPKTADIDEVELDEPSIEVAPEMENEIESAGIESTGIENRMEESEIADDVIEEKRSGHKGHRPPKTPHHEKPKHGHARHHHEHEHGGGRMFNKILSKLVIILVLLCSLVAGGLFYLQMFNKPVAPEVKTMVIQDQLMYCQELVSIKYKYSDIVALKKSAKIGPSKSYSIIKYSGVIRAGIADMSMCDYEVSEDGKTVKVTLPDVVILGNDISSQEVFDESSSIFVPITLDEVFSEIEKSKEDVLEEIIQDGIITEAREYSKSVVRQILLSAGYENVIVM